MSEMWEAILIAVIAAAVLAVGVLLAMWVSKR